VRTALKVLFLSVMAILLFEWFGGPYKVRFRFSPLNYWVYFLLCLTLPSLSLILSLIAKDVRDKAAGILFSVLITIPTSILAFGAFMEINAIYERGYPASYEYLKVAEVEFGTYRLYRTNCGATCAFGLDLREEIDLPIGLKLVKSVWSKYGEEDAELIANEDTIRVIVDGNLAGEIK
jgi:hypothetical protein